MLNSDYLLRRMTEQDLDAIMKIEKESFTLPWSRDSYRGELINQFANYLVCDFAGDIVGYAGAWIVFEDAHITNIAIAKSFRNKGLGTVLMQEIEKIARSKKALRIILEVRPSNTSALAMYEKLGYVQTGIREAYYSDNGEDALIMTKYLF
ncbi:MAG: ribosomal protein S18-alanine N-acetyltransferase [Syntrophomonadaceae bacterium]|jgi:ribosomal-protein-alanine N-acetyltransferase